MVNVSEVECERKREWERMGENGKKINQRFQHNLVAPVFFFPPPLTVKFYDKMIVNIVMSGLVQCDCTIE